MVKTLSTMLELGTPAPAFSLPDVVSGRAISLASFGDEKAVLGPWPIARLRTPFLTQRRSR